MKTTVVKGMLMVGGAALASGALVAEEAQAQSIEGAYGGLTFGIASGSADIYSFSGLVAGAFVGYNMAMGDSFGSGAGGMVVGPEFVWFHRVNTDYDDVGYRNLIDLRLRVGQTFGDTLVYGAAGWSRANAVKFGSSSSVTGWNVGVGFEMGLGSGMFLGGDVTYRRMGDSFGKIGGNANLTTGTVRIGFRF
jgi:opacity protein-like surface antigen